MDEPFRHTRTLSVQSAHTQTNTHIHTSTHVCTDTHTHTHTGTGVDSKWMSLSDTCANSVRYTATCICIFGSFSGLRPSSQSQHLHSACRVIKRSRGVGKVQHIRKGGSAVGRMVKNGSTSSPATGQSHPPAQPHLRTPKYEPTVPNSADCKIMFPIYPACNFMNVEQEM